MNIENAKIAIDKMASFLPEHILNDLYKDHESTAHIILKDDNKVVFSIVFNNGDKRILTVTIKRHEIDVHYNGTMQIFSQLITADFYSDVLNVLFLENLKSETHNEAVTVKSSVIKTSLNTKGNTNMTTLNNITFGLNVVTKYSNGKIIATMKHGSDSKTTVKMSYDHSLNTGENHYTACLLCLEKVKKQDEKEFSVLSYSYNEKDDGYSFTCKRIV